MIIQHPVSDYQGMPPENVFFAYNDQKIQLGTGYVVQFTESFIPISRYIFLPRSNRSLPRDAFFSAR